MEGAIEGKREGQRNLAIWKLYVLIIYSNKCCHQIYAAPWKTEV